MRDQVNLEHALDLAPPQQAADALVAVVIHILWTGRTRELLPRFEALGDLPEAARWPMQTRCGLARGGHRLALLSGQMEIQLQEAIRSLRVSCLTELASPQALAAHQDLIAWYQDHNQPQNSLSTINLAHIELMLGQPTAVATARRAMGAVQGDLRLEVFAHGALADTLAAQGAVEEALPHAEAAIRGFRTLNKWIMVPRPLITRAACLLRLGDTAAEAAIQEAMEAVRSLEGHFRALAALIAARWPERGARLQAAWADGTWRALLDDWLSMAPTPV